MRNLEAEPRPGEVDAARGMSGQYVVIVPADELVIVRIGLTHAENDEFQGIKELVRAVIEAVRSPGLEDPDVALR